MNSICRAITMERNRLLKLSPPSIITHQKHAASSHTYTSRNMLRNLKSSPKPKSTTSNDAVLNKQVTWAKPSEIPWQAKVVNSVNLIGRVKIPVQFEASDDGKQWAGTIISQDDHQPPSTSMPSFWIPVIFEGDLAHIAMSHLKEKDFVHVVGHLSVDVPPFKLSEVQANVQVMAHSVNFVQDPQSKQVSTPGELDRGTWTSKNTAIVENDVSTQQSQKKLDTVSKQSDTSEKRMMDVAFEEESYIQLLNGAESSPVYTPKETKRLPSNHEVDKKNSHGWWKDLVTNTEKWLDNREKKRKGLVKPNYPDFKHKDTGAGLWLDSAPAEISQDLERLFGVLPRKGGSGTVSATVNRSDDADSWKDLLENPYRWWDNRLDKKNIKGPDFKNKESGKALWLSSAPEWVSSSLPPLKAKKVDLDTRKKAWAS